MNPDSLESFMNLRSSAKNVVYIFHSMPESLSG